MKKLITPDVTLYRALKKVTAEYPQRPAVTHNDQTITFTELVGQVDGLAQGLRNLGVKAGDKVDTILPNSLETV